MLYHSNTEPKVERSLSQRFMVLSHKVLLYSDTQEDTKFLKELYELRLKGTENSYRQKEDKKAT